MSPDPPADQTPGGLVPAASPSRRRFAKAGATALASVAGAAACGAPRPLARTVSPTRRLGMVIDLARCTGCRACAVACKAENGVRLGGFRSWVSERETGRYPTVRRHFLPRLCNHCQNPACLRVCPTGATHKRADGLVAIDKQRCIGCRHCMAACPYDARYFNPRRDPEGERLFPARSHGTVDKCDFCAHRVDAGVVPACVNTCPTGARVFGDLDDPGSEVSRARSAGSATALLPELGTEPSVLYVGDQPDVFRTEGPGGAAT